LDPLGNIKDAAPAIFDQQRNDVPVNFIDRASANQDIPPRFALLMRLTRATLAENSDFDTINAFILRLASPTVTVGHRSGGCKDVPWRIDG
jgi:hypothetical protein